MRSSVLLVVSVASAVMLSGCTADSTDPSGDGETLSVLVGADTRAAYTIQMGPEDLTYASFYAGGVCVEGEGPLEIESVAFDSSEGSAEVSDFSVFPADFDLGARARRLDSFESVPASTTVAVRCGEADAGFLGVEIERDPSQATSGGEGLVIAYEDAQGRPGETTLPIALRICHDVSSPCGQDL